MTTRCDHETLSEAAGWLLRLADAPDDDALRRDLEAWLAAGGNHHSAWTRVNQTWNLLGAHPAPTAAPAISLTARQHRAMPRRPARARIVATALAALLLLWLLLPTLLIAFRADYRTGTGETRQVRLADGSSVDLGGRSAIAVRVEARSADGGGASRRSVTLLEGEAFFDVAADPTRPFVVEAGGVTARVLGTAFDIEVTSLGTRIALQRGALDVFTPGAAPIRLTPGKIVTVTRDGAATVAAIAPSDIGAWRGGKVVLDGIPIRAAIDLIQRYSTAWIAVTDAGLLDRRVSGLIDLADPDRALAALIEPFGATARSVSPLVRLVARW